MKILIVSTLGALLLGGCTEKAPEHSATPAEATLPNETAAPAGTPTIGETGSEPQAAADTSSQSATSENHEEGTWAGQIAFAQPVSMFNYVGAESGDFAPMRFRNDSEAGKKILKTCPNGAMCEFTGAIEWLDEPPPENASAIGQIVRVDSVRRTAAATP